MKFLIIIFMIAALLTVFAGFALLIKGGEVNRKYGNKLMVLRVTLQGTAILLIAALAYLAGKSNP